jgi:hypothetical protein
MTVQQLRRRIARLEQRRGADLPKLVIVSQLLGPDAWRDADGWTLFFLDAEDRPAWTRAEKADEIAQHLNVSREEAQRLAQLDDAKCVI